MPRPRKPTWVDPGPGRPGYFRTIIDGVRYRCPDNVPRDEKPQWQDVPKRAWDWLHKLEAEHAEKKKAGPAH